MLRVIIIILAFLIAVFIWLPNSLKSPFVIKNEKNNIDNIIHYFIYSKYIL